MTGDGDRRSRWVSGELLPHLGQLRLLLDLPHQPETTSASPRIRFEAECVVVSPIGADAGDDALRIPLPAAVDPASLRASRSHGGLLRLALSLKKPPRGSLPPSPPESHPKAKSCPETPPKDGGGCSVRPWRPVSALACARCRAILAGTGGAAGIPAVPFDRHVALPSQHWHEMLECWACHHEDYSSTLPGQRGGLIFAQKLSLLIADASLIVHPSDALLDQIEISYTGNESTFQSTRWIRIRCQQCKEPVGECFMNRNTPDDSLDASHVGILKFFKYRVHGICMDGSILPTSFLHCFVRELLEAAKAHATYRFQVYDQDTSRRDEPVLHLWLFAPDIQVARIDDDGVTSKWISAIKVLTRRVDDNQTNTGPSHDPTRVESLYLSGDLLMRLCDQLEANAREFVPQDERMMLGYSVSVLEKDT